MLLAIDIGNTNIVLGIFEGKTLSVSWRLATLHDRTADELWVLASRFFAEREVRPETIDGVVLSSVVPALTRSVTEMVSRGLGQEPLNVDASNAGLPIRYETPAEVGADRLANAVASHERYGGPLIVLDFGTATTFDVVDATGNYCGGVITPGINLSLEALHQAAAKLPRVAVSRPKSVIGKGTVEAMQSGIFWGYVSMIEGLVERIQGEFATPMQVVATGGLAPLFIEATDSIKHADLDLTLRGLYAIHLKNRPS